MEQMVVLVRLMVTQQMVAAVVEVVAVVILETVERVLVLAVEATVTQLLDQLELRVKRLTEIMAA
jgi:hypothetical protein